jgi:competence protein ComGC
MKSCIKSCRGVTLVEMLLYISIVSIFLFSIATFSSSVVKIKVSSQTQNEVNQQSLQMMNMLSYIIKNAQYVASPSVGISSSTLILGIRYPSLATTTLYVASGTLFVQEGTSTSVALTGNRITVSSLSFTPVKASSTTWGSVTLYYTLSHYNPSSKAEFAATSSMYSVIPVY